MARRVENDGIAFRDASQWDAWLFEHHGQSDDVWLLIGKKGTDKESLKIGDALDVALCYGWIDSQRKGHDADYFLQRYSPRRAKSPWSKLNVDRVEALTRAKRMRPSGLAEVRVARADGGWARAYESQRNAAVPPDLVAALKQNRQAKMAFDALDKGGQYAVILSLLKAITPEARATRLRKAVATLEGVTLSERKSRTRQSRTKT